MRRETPDFTHQPSFTPDSPRVTARTERSRRSWDASRHRPFRARIALTDAFALIRAGPRSTRVHRVAHRRARHNRRAGLPRPGRRAGMPSRHLTRVPCALPPSGKCTPACRLLTATAAVSLPVRFLGGTLTPMDESSRRPSARALDTLTSLSTPSAAPTEGCGEARRKASRSQVNQIC